MAIRLKIKKAQPSAINCTHSPLVPCNPFPEIPDPFGYGQRAVDYIRSLKHPKSTLPGQTFQLDPWAEEIVRRIYGPCDPDGSRIVQTVVILLPRGNRKTTLGAALSLLHTDGPEAVPGGEVLFAAADQKQAKIGLREATGIVDASGFNVWRKGGGTWKNADCIKVQEYLNRVAFPNGSWLEAIASDAGTQHGRTPAFALLDEIHAWPKRDLWDVIATGSAKVSNSLRVVITTSGAGRETIAWEVIDYARKVDRGEIEDPATLPILYEAAPDADWQDEALWHAVNPGMAYGYPSLKGLRQLAKEAQHKPAELAAFKQLHLNIWQAHGLHGFVDMQTYDVGASPFQLDELKGQPCWLGVDLSSTSDLTVIVAAWRDGHGGYIVHPWFFCPGDNLERRQAQSGHPYVKWAQAGHLTATPGNVVDYDFVEDRIRRIARDYDVREIALDPALAARTISNLLNDGLPVIEFRQGFFTMAPAIAELERAILAGKLQHGGHPVLRWNFDNIVVEMDAAGNKKFTKGKAKDKIDGAVATAMAVARAATGEDQRSVYETDDRPDGLLVW